MTAPAILLADDPPTREQWLEQRRSGLGGSDAAAVLGLSPWRSPVSVYLEKLGLSEPRPENLPMRAGKRLEPFILDEYLRETGGRADLNTRLYRHPEAPEILGTPDALREDEPLGVELKWVSERGAAAWGEPGTDEVPDYYHVQCDVYMAITGLPAWDLAVILGGRELRIYRLNRDRALEAELISRLRAFWRDHVLAQVPPAVDGSADARQWIESRFPRQKRALRPASRAEELLVSELAAIRSRRAALEEEEERLRNLLTASIGESEGIEGPFGRVTWKSGKDLVRTDWRSVVNDLNPPADLVARHTSVVPAPRRFLTHLTEGGK